MVCCLLELVNFRFADFCLGSLVLLVFGGFACLLVYVFPLNFELPFRGWVIQTLFVLCYAGVCLDLGCCLFWFCFGCLCWFGCFALICSFGCNLIFDNFIRMFGVCVWLGFRLLCGCCVWRSLWLVCACHFDFCWNCVLGLLVLFVCFCFICMWVCIELFTFELVF